MEVLPSQLRLAPPPTIPQARSYLFKQKSDLQEFNVEKGTRIRINIPRLQRTYLTKDSYIRFKLNIGIPVYVNGTGTRPPAVFLDRAGAYNLFDRIEVYDYLGSTLLEQTQNIPALWTLLQDINANMMTANGKNEAIHGMQGAYSADDFTSTDTVESVIVRANVGGKKLTDNASLTTSSFYSHEFSLPVLSFLGNFSEKFVPLHNGFSIDFILSSVAQALVSRTDPSTANNTVTPSECWISNFEYCCQVIELGDQAESLVMSSNGSDPWTIHTKQFRYFSDQLTAASSSFGIDLNLNVVSLRNIRFSMRPQDYQNSILFPGNSHRIRNFLDSFNFQYGSSHLPELAGIQCRGINLPQPRGTYTTYSSSNLAAYHFTQAYTELIKTGEPGLFFDSRLECPIRIDEFSIDTALSSLTGQGDGGITAGVPTAVDLDTRCGKFAGGIDLRLSSKEVISGIDTNGLLVRLNGKFDYSRVQDVIAAIIDIWAEHDAFVQIIPGVAVTTTF
jgi:hypothetical protein